jgi:predicted nucleic acid-binding protein
VLSETNGSSATSPRLIVDANVCVWGVLYPPVGRDVRPWLRRWSDEGRDLIAPSLWLAEVASAIRAVVHQRTVSSIVGEQALQEVLGLGVTLVPLDADLTRAAYAWSERLGQRRAYDGFYLALADREGAELWTADERLANSARAAGVDWVHWIGEPI